MRAIVACFGRKMIQIDTQEYSRNSRNPFRLDDLASSLPPMAGRCLPLLEGLAGLSTLADNYDELEPLYIFATGVVLMPKMGLLLIVWIGII